MKRAMLAGVVMIMMASGCATAPKEPEVPDLRDNDPMIVQLSATARKAFDTGDIPTSVVLYRRALDRARAMDNPSEIGRNAYNLAAGLIALEEWDEVTGLLAEAERETIRAGGDAGPILLLAAEAQMMREEWSAAEVVIDRLEALPVNDVTRGHAYVLRARIAAERKDAGRAEGFLQRARGHLGKQKDAGLAAAVSEVAAEIALLKGAWSDAAAAYDRQAAWLQRAGRAREMAEALERAGRNYLVAGEGKLAADRFYRSARSLMAQGHYLDALRVVEQAVQAAPPDGADDVGEAIARLFEDIRREVEKASRAGVGTP
jgi:tetratricopeptide (TPR) repeat protein